MATLVLVRHGRTVWGEENRFTGWGDTPLHPTGFKEAEDAGKLLKKHRFRFGASFASRLIRSAQTLDVIAEELGESAGERRSDWRLNERHYGALQGESREAIAKVWGSEKVAEWRRSFHGLPPALDDDDPRFLEQLERFPDIDRALHPRTESMAQGAARTFPVWRDEIAPILRRGEDVLVVAHTSPIRGIARAIKNLSDEECGAYRVANAVPQRFVFDGDLKLVDSGFILGGLSDRLRLAMKTA